MTNDEQLQDAEEGLAFWRDHIANCEEWGYGSASSAVWAIQSMLFAERWLKYIKARIADPNVDPKRHPYTEEHQHNWCAICWNAEQLHQEAA
jgi:hypothetical protein